jgi:flagellin-like protein
LFIRKRHRRRAVSELVAAVLTIAITLVAGAALFGYINGQAAASENKLGAAAGGNANFLAEKFVVVQMGFSSSCGSPSPNCAIVWLYNNGQVDLQLKWVHMYNGSRTGNNIPLNFTFNGTSTLGGTCASGTGTMSPGFSLDIPQQSSPTSMKLFISSSCSFTPGTTYYVNILAQFGNNVVYYAVR